MSGFRVAGCGLKRGVSQSTLTERTLNLFEFLDVITREPSPETPSEIFRVSNSDQQYNPHRHVVQLTQLPLFSLR